MQVFIFCKWKKQKGKQTKKTITNKQTNKQKLQTDIETDYSPDHSSLDVFQTGDFVPGLQLLPTRRRSI